MSNTVQRAKEIFEQEIGELNKVAANIDEHFSAVVDTLYACKGKVVVMGIGKT